MLFLYWSVDSTRDNHKQADGKYHFTQDFINGILSHYFRTGSFTFDITQCRNYDASDGTAVIENVSGFGGGPDLRIADVQVLGGSTVQVTADFYNANPFFDNKTAGRESVKPGSGRQSINLSRTSGIAIH